MVLENKRKQTDVASSLGINANVLNRRVNEYKGNGKAACPSQGKSNQEEPRVRDLEAKVKRLTMGTYGLKLLILKTQVLLSIFLRLRQNQSGSTQQTGKFPYFRSCVTLLL